jgi:hypothetical protein
MNIQAQFVFNLEETQKQYKDNVDEHWKEQSSFKVKTKFGFDNKYQDNIYFLCNGPFTIVKKIQWCWLSIQASRFHENPSFDSCSLLELCYAFVIPSF